ncbi:MAG: serine hydrolase [Clostridia bacterium]|nr:serine hydrolase [Clostridia bacterium]
MRLRTEGLEEALERIGGHTGVYIKNLATGEVWARGASDPIEAASVIKLPVMIEAFRAAAAGELSLGETHALRDGERLPSCGTLKAMHTGIEMTLLDLVRLMIIVSDNAATNILIRRLGMQCINRTIEALHLTGTRVNRLLFDAEASARGIINTVSAADMGRVLEGLYAGEIVSREASRQMLDILLDQQLNGKLPFYLHDRDIDVAHKTGEDENLTHDVGILFAEEPIVCCLLGERLYAPDYVRLMQDTARQLCL